MSPAQVKEIIDKSKAQNITFAVLELTKPATFKVKGFKVRTPFGMGEVYNVREYPDRVGITVRVEIVGMEKFLKKLEKAIS